VFVVDEMEQGFPVAFCISTRVNHETMVLFFKSLLGEKEKKEVGVLMTDDAPVFKNAWSEVMGPPAKFLLCSWHVDRAWQGKIKQIKNENTRKEVYRELKLITSQLEEDKFEEMFNIFLKKVLEDVDTSGFGRYLQSYYNNRKEQWAQTYRTNTFINTNMYLEAFHKQFKYFYQDGKKNKRVDKCIKALYAYVEDSKNKRIRVAVRGCSSKKTALILPRHQKGNKIKNMVKKLSKPIGGVKAMW